MCKIHKYKVNKIVLICLLTLLATQQPLNTLDELMSVAISVDPNLLQLLVAHVSQDIQSNLH